MPRKALIVKNKKVAELVEKKLKVMQELERKLGRKPTDEEIAEAMGMPVKKVKRIFTTRRYLRCSICGRPRGVFKKFGICRICFRRLAVEGKLPGVKKASW